MKGILLALVAASASFGGFADNVFDGLKFVMDIRGDGPNPNGGIVGNMLSSSSAAKRAGGVEGESDTVAQIVSEAIVPPSLPWEENTVKAIWLPQTLNAETNMILATAVDFPDCGVKTTTQTAYVRFKWDGAPNPGKAYPEWLILNGYDFSKTGDGASSAGVGWGISIVNKVGEETAKGYLCAMIPQEYARFDYDGAKLLETGKWYDLFVEITPSASDATKSVLTCYVMDTPSKSDSSNWKIASFSTMGSTSLKKLAFHDDYSKIRIGAETITGSWWAHPDAKSGVYSKGFNGKVANLMMWNRTLTTDERYQVVRNAFGYDWRFGAPDGSSAEFADDDSGLAKSTVVAKSDAVGVVPNKLTEASPTLTIKSPIVDRESGLGKVLAIAPVLSDGATAKVSLSVNGTEIGTYDLSTARGRNIVIPGKSWTADADGYVNLSLTRVAPFSGTLQFDAITLCGGWKMSGAMSTEGVNTRRVHPIGTTSPQSMPRSTVVCNQTWANGYDTMKVMAYVPPDGNDLITYTFSVKVQGMGNLNSQPDTTQVHEFYVNGNKFATFPTIAAYQTLKARVPNEYLVSGENVFEIKNAATVLDSGLRWVAYNFFQLDVSKRKGLSIIYY